MGIGIIEEKAKISLFVSKTQVIVNKNKGVTNAPVHSALKNTSKSLNGFAYP